MCSGESWRGGVPRSPSHESVTTELSLFSVSSAASDAKILKLLACKAGQGPDPSLRIPSPNPDSRLMDKRSSSALPVQSESCRELLWGCAALCAALGLRRSFSAGDVSGGEPGVGGRGFTSELCVCPAVFPASPSRSASVCAAAGGPLGDSRAPADNRRVRQNYIKRRLMSTYKALERMSQSEFNLDKLEAAAVSAVSSAGPTTLAVPPRPLRAVHPEAAHLALTAADLERERGRPLSKYERNMMIFNWLHTLDEAQPF